MADYIIKKYSHSFDEVKDDQEKLAIVACLIVKIDESFREDRVNAILLGKDLVLKERMLKRIWRFFTYRGSIWKGVLFRIIPLISGFAVGSLTKNTIENLVKRFAIGISADLLTIIILAILASLVGLSVSLIFEKYF